MFGKIVSFSSFIGQSSKMSPLTVSPIAIINSMSLYNAYSFMQIMYFYIFLFLPLSIVVLICNIK